MAERGLLTQAVHQRARNLTAATGRLTSALRMEPDFLIVGAQRCGTTSLYKTLTQHPAVLPAGLHKGVHYFDTDYARGSAWFRGHFPLRTTARLRERRTSGPVITGEASPYYMFHPLAAERIAADLPEVRLVVLLRDPVERAYSAHTHEQARGFEPLPFEEALAAEDGRLAGEEERLRRDPHAHSEAHQHQAYLARGRYIEQLRNLEGLVGRERLCVIDADQLFADPVLTLPGVISFLGLSPWLPDRLEKRNARPRSSLEPALRTQLRDYFEPYDEELAKWWGHCPTWRT